MAKFQVSAASFHSVAKKRNASSKSLTFTDTRQLQKPHCYCYRGPAIFCEVSLQGTGTGLQVSSPRPLDGVMAALGPLLSFPDSQMKRVEKSTHLEGEGRWGSCLETGRRLSLGRGLLAKGLQGLSSLSVLVCRGEGVSTDVAITALFHLVG